MIRVTRHGKVLRIDTDSGTQWIPDEFAQDPGAPLEMRILYDLANYLEKPPAAAPEAVAYLDIGAGGYLYLGSNLPEVQLLALPKGRHALGIIGTYGIDGYVAAPVAAAQEVVGTDRADELLTAEMGDFGVHDPQACEVFDRAVKVISRLYAAPVAEAPVDARTLASAVEKALGWREGKRDAELDSLLEQAMAILNGTPAAPGIDLSKLQRYRMASSHENHRNLYQDDTGPWVKIQDVERSLIDASPKGGSITQFKGLTRELTKLSKKSEGAPIWIEPEEAAALLQATSAEVGGVSDWKPISTAPLDQVIVTKIDDASGPRKEQLLIQKQRSPDHRPMWFFPDMSMYVYYTPTHWRHKQPTSHGAGEN